MSTQKSTPNFDGGSAGSYSTGEGASVGMGEGSGSGVSSLGGEVVVGSGVAVFGFSTPRCGGGYGTNPHWMYLFLAL